MAKEYTKAELESKLVVARIKNDELHGFIDDIGTEVLPICGEIAGAKGFLKVFKIFKLAIYLAKFLIDAFDNKPSKTNWY